MDANPDQIKVVEQLSCYGAVEPAVPAKVGIGAGVILRITASTAIAPPTTVLVPSLAVARALGVFGVDPTTLMDIGASAFHSALQQPTTRTVAAVCGSAAAVTSIGTVVKANPAAVVVA